MNAPSRPVARNVSRHQDRAGAAGVARPGSTLRLTGRGRLLAIVVFVVLAFVLVSLGSALHAASQAGTGPTRPATRYVTVQPGQTLWELARQVAPADDPRDTVDRLRALNGLNTSSIQVGQRLIVPA